MAKANTWMSNVVRHCEGETWLRNCHCDGRQSAWHDPLSTVAQFLSSLDSNRLWERLAAACGKCSWRVHWSIASGPWCSCQHRPAIFSPDFCFPESCHTRPCVYDGNRLLNKRMPVAVTVLTVFTHVYNVYTLRNTCRPTRAPLVKVRRQPSPLLHVSNVRHQELSSMYYIGQPAYRTPATAVNARRQQAAYVRSCCIQPA